MCVTQSQPCLQWCVEQGRERKEEEQTVMEGQVTVAAPVSKEASDCLIIPHKAGVTQVSGLLRLALLFIKLF